MRKLSKTEINSVVKVKNLMRASSQSYLSAARKAREGDRQRMFEADAIKRALIADQLDELISSEAISERVSVTENENEEVLPEVADEHSLKACDKLFQKCEAGTLRKMLREIRLSLGGLSMGRRLYS